MKADVLTIAVVIFVLGILVSGLGLNDFFQDETAPVAALQQGIATK